MNNPITDIDGRTVLTGTASRDGVSAHIVCVGFGGPADEDGYDPQPLLFLDSDMAVMLAHRLVDTVEYDQADDSDDEDAHNHRHDLRALAGRLVLARITNDHDAWLRAVEDAGDCPGCWQKIAGLLTSTTADLAVKHHGHDEAVRKVEGTIADALDHADEDDADRPQTTPAPIGRPTPEGEAIALRLVLAVARHDRDAMMLIANQLSQHHPGDIVNELACIAADFAHHVSSAHGDDSDEGAVAVIEQWIQLVLDDIEEEGEST